MARPKADSNKPSARERIETAFWDMLASVPFSQITVSAISSKAGVNHNTFYYHFSSIEDLAEKVFLDNMLPQLPLIMLPVLSGDQSKSGGLEEGDGPDPEVVSAHFRRARLYASSGSALLTGILRDSIMRLWLDTAGLEDSQLIPSERDQLAFIFGGIVSMIAEMGDEADVGRMAEMVGSPLGKGVLASLTAIATRERS
ncbi:MAG: TetR/AcrR family transcriptional regulator [Coriobacteriales bacterium]|jgi:AcrR family transcriptional regulator